MPRNTFSANPVVILYRLFASKSAIAKIQAAVIVVIIVLGLVGVAYYYSNMGPTSPTTSTQAQVQYKKTLIMAMPTEPESLDIQQVNNEFIIHDLIFQDTMNYDANMTIVPDFATAAEFNGTVITIHFPHNATFSNGDPITAASLNDSMTRYERLSPYGSDYSSVQSVQFPDPYTAEIVMSSPSTYSWYNDIPVIYGAMVDAKTAAQMGDAAFGRSPIGSGPFKVQEWVQGSQVVLVRNDLYKTNLPFVQNKGPNPYIDTVIIRFIPEDLTRISEFQAGSVDVVTDVPIDAVTALQSDQNVNVYEHTTAGIDFMMMNVLRPPLDDVRVRQALNYAVNRTELEATMKDTVIPCYSYMSPTMLAYNPAVENAAKSMYAYNPDKAKSLLTEAGWTMGSDGIFVKNGQPLKLTFLVANDVPDLQRVGPVIQAEFAKVGVQLDLREYTYDYIRQQTRNWDFDLAERAYEWFDPAGILPYLLDSKQSNYTYRNPQVDDLLEKDFLGALDPAARVDTYTKMQNILLNDAPWVPLMIEKVYTAARKNVQGLIVLPNAFGSIFLNDTKVLASGSMAISPWVPLIANTKLSDARKDALLARISGRA